MKILHVAVFTHQSTNVWQADAFENLGHRVIRYDYRQKAKELDGKLGNENPKRDEHLIVLCKEERPDIILYSKCNQMDVRVIEEGSKIGKTVLWYMDFNDNINSELIDKFKTCNYVFCSRWDGLNVARQYNNNVYRLQGGYNPKVHYPIDVPKVRDVVFIGKSRSDRTVYQKETGFEIINGVYNEDHSKIVSETKINLSFTEGDGVSNRIYKIMAAKGFVLTQPWYNMEEDFEVGKDFDIFISLEHLKKQIKYYLENENKRESIAKHGYKTVQKYDNTNYARKIIGVM